ncbi:ricin B lectin domain-containing protein [Collybia nuda]|uniref:Ricin B lectin domain-containing protein n=1 Tax=Collybia nuda TaxID=64659 RepID=A0A9P5YFB0_9AGAR|nr:ricin B lectin domain-containing protein [Collybia nuda]
MHTSTSTSGTKIHVTDHGAGAQNVTNSPATSTVETIVDSSDWSGVGGSGNLTITTVTTSIMRLATRYSTKPEDGKMYKIINVKAKSVIDLNGTDNISIIGHADHGGTNQKWLLEHTGGHWTLRSAWDARYIGIDARPEEGACLIAVDRPFEWDIWPDERNKSAYRIFVPNAPAPGINFDLSQEYGNPDSGIPIILWKKDEAELGQVWMFEEV